MTDDGLERLRAADAEISERERRLDAMIGNRRAVGYFGKLLSRLGLGNEPADTPLDVLLDIAVRRVQNLNDLVEYQRVSVVIPDLVEPASEHKHHVQFRVLDLDDGIQYQTEWVPAANIAEARHNAKNHSMDLQLSNLDVRVEEYHRCNWVNLTSVHEKEHYDT